jgi:zinc transport system substrate-binding protein
VAAGFYPLAFAVEQIGGDRVDVENLTPPGVEPHDLELSARDVERIQSADLVLYLGNGFQPAVEDAALRSVAPVDLLDAVDLIEGGDPHVWLDPVRYGAIAARVGRMLQAEAAATDFSARLDELDRELEEGLADCERRTIVTSHGAFGDLARRYDLRQVSIAGLSPDAEPSPSDLASVTADVRRHHVTTIFFEALVSPAVAKAVAEETGARTDVLDPLESITDDSQGDGYVQVMQSNLANLRRALGCR